MIILLGLLRWPRGSSGHLGSTGHKRCRITFVLQLVFLSSPPAPGEEVVVSLFPLSHVSTQVIDIYYIISVAGTTVFPGYDVAHKDDKFWEVLLEVRLL